MPLIIAVVAIIVFFVVMKDNGAERDRTNANYELARRKTNAEKERSILDGYMKQGKTFDEAYSATQSEMLRLGYVPCIPKNAYGTNCAGTKVIFNGEETSYIGGASNRFDSSNVKSRKEQLLREGRPLTEENIYANYPKNKAEYVRDLKNQTVRLEAIPVGEWFTYPGYGTVEVIGHDYSPLVPGTGRYRVKVLQTGEIVTHIQIGDRKIRRVNSRFN